jgi:GH15 family glucan-1,4-alpha-glucosidase
LFLKERRSRTRREDGDLETMNGGPMGEKVREDSSYKRIEEYGLIGNLETCALVGPDGSIDWRCFPYLDSPSVFAAILDRRKGGFFSVRPRGRFESILAYVPHTNVLRTRFELAEGRVILTDFMPVDEPSQVSRRSVFRRVFCQKKKVEMEATFSPCFDYGRRKAHFVAERGCLRAAAGDESLWLHAPFALDVLDGKAAGSSVIEEGETWWLVLGYGDNGSVSAADCEDTLKKTTEFWTGWANVGSEEQLDFEPSWRDLTLRSSLALKLLTRTETGAIAAACTMSLPEIVQGVRNWDYRYAWVRDAAFTVQALNDLGHRAAAEGYFRWITDLCTSGQDLAALQVCYRLDGSAVPREEDLKDLEGYRGSRPVRLGNEAAGQFQLDIYGELVNALYETIFHGHRVPEGIWPFVRSIVDRVCEKWREPDSGIWEMRKPPAHYTYSKLMAWVAVDRGLRMATTLAPREDVSRWRRAASNIRATTLSDGFSNRMNSFVQTFGSEDLDATSLLIPILGFLDPRDQRVTGTIDAVLNHLTEKGLVYRYRVDDGLPGQESPFVLCSFWLVTALILSGRLKEAEELFEKIARRAGPVGLYAEEIDIVSGEHRGNYPQGFSHIGFINSAFYLSRARKGQAAEPRSTQHIRTEGGSGGKGGKP